MEQGAIQEVEDRLADRTTVGSGFFPFILDV
jgi:hypothetical protein